MRNALLYIENNVLEEKITKIDGEAITLRSYNYPIDAIKELLANAVYHRSYQINEPITITNTPIYIEIKSFPGLDRSISEEMIESLDIRSSGEYRNRRIGNYLKELGLTEGRNTGIPKAIEALKENNNPLPLFITDPERRSLTVRIGINPEFIHSNNQNRYEDQDDMSLRERIIAFLATGSMSKRDLSEKLGYKGISPNISDNSPA